MNKTTTHELTRYNSPFTNISIDIQNTVSPQELLQISAKYEVTSEIISHIINNNTYMVTVLLDSYDIITDTFKNKPRLVLHRDAETSEKLLFIHINPSVDNHKKRFEYKLDLLKRLYENNKNYSKYFSITFD